jgi:hypothetical protein
MHRRLLQQSECWKHFAGHRRQLIDVTVGIITPNKNKNNCTLIFYIITVNINNNDEKEFRKKSSIVMCGHVDFLIE